MIIDKSVYKRRKPKKLTYNATMIIRVESDKLEEFKMFYGRKWGAKVRQLMDEGLYRDKKIQSEETARRMEYMRK